VIKSAPKVAEGAKRLWNAVGRNEVQDVTPVWLDESEAELGGASTSELHARLVATQARLKELHQQMQASAELIKQLADQNTLLVARIEQNRVRLKWLTVATVVLGLVTIGQWVVRLA
jgi:hypothetical protein